MIVACVWPEQVLRVPRKCSDQTVLRLAYRHLSRQVHPDKNHAAGAADAMGIAADCYAMLHHAASGGKSATAVPAYMRQARGMHTSSSQTSLSSSYGAGTGGGAHTGEAGSQPGNCGSGAAPSDHQQHQGQAGQARQSSSFEVGGGAMPRHGSSGSHEHWNQQHLMSEDGHQGGPPSVAAVAGSERQADTEATSTVWSRSSSASSLASVAASPLTAAAAAASPRHVKRRASASSLAVPGGGAAAKDVQRRASCSSLGNSYGSSFLADAGDAGWGQPAGAAPAASLPNGTTSVRRSSSNQALAGGAHAKTTYRVKLTVRKN